MWRRWAQYRRVQRAKLAEIRHGYLGDREESVSEDEQFEHDLLTSVLPQGGDAPSAAPAGS